MLTMNKIKENIKEITLGFINKNYEQNHFDLINNPEDLLATIKKERLELTILLDLKLNAISKLREKIFTEGMTDDVYERIKTLTAEINNKCVYSKAKSDKFGEVFTPYNIIDLMYDGIEKGFFKNPNQKVIDACGGLGNFLIALLPRFMEGLKDVIPDNEARLRHIVCNMFYYCEIQESSAALYERFFKTLLGDEDVKLNIYRGSFLEEDFDEYMENEWCVDKFDLGVMNPPYQLQTKGNVTIPLYNLFLEKAITISNATLSINPSRWMTGGLGLSSFRKKMLNRKDIKLIMDLGDSKKVFNNSVNIRGGVQYLLIDSNHNGLVNYNGDNISLNKYDVFVEPKYYSILEKIINHNNLNEIYHPEGKVFFGITTNDSRLKDSKENDNYIKCYVSKTKGIFKFIDRRLIKDNPLIDTYKLIIARAVGKGDDGFGNMLIAHPNEAYSSTYCSFRVNSKLEAENLLLYMNTKFCNFLLYLRKKTQDITGNTIKWIPLVDLKEEWSDEKLYDYFNLTKDEIEIINDDIRNKNIMKYLK